MINPQTGREFVKGFFKDFAKGQSCLVRIPGICNHDPETTVLSHVSIPGYKAMGSRKASLPDLCAAWSCSACHDAVDWRTHPNRDGAQVVEWAVYHMEGVMRTLDALVKAGVLPNP